jgi:neutral ceramidase
MRSLSVGCASVAITPPVGTPMDGYSRRQGVSQGVHDDLYARAIVFDDGQTRAALVSCDLIDVDRYVVAAARQQAAEATGIPAEQIMVATVHTHAGPAGLRRGVDEALAGATARQIARAIAAADREKRPGVLKVGRCTVDSVSQNRRDPSWPIDTALRLLLVDGSERGEPPLAAVINFACHATVLFQTNLLISADYPGYAVRTFQKLFPDTACLFLQGACADVNPVWMEQDFAEVERVGAIVGSAAARLALELRPLGRGQRAWNIRWFELTEKPVTAGELLPDVRLRAASRQVELPLRPSMPPEEYEARLSELAAQRQALPPGAPVDQRRALSQEVTRVYIERMEAQRRAQQPEGRRSLQSDVMALALTADLAILGLPGEFFVETAEAIRQASGVRHLLVACYANDYVSYVCPPAVYEEGGYEAGVTPFAPEAEAIVKREALAVLTEAMGS